ncbi:hypothetical protein HMPREF3069_05840 [Achromobacter xylosoxidans]|nr:hypothetical protein HMPREF2772_06775 [Achromobacter xylosoxidans]OFS61035.1 hypothetical protein HMPREF3069_05840 [Achromobacter xylosoxidans]
MILKSPLILACIAIFGLTAAVAGEADGVKAKDAHHSHYHKERDAPAPGTTPLPPAPEKLDSPSCSKATGRFDGKIVRSRWTRGSNDDPVTDTAVHYVDLNLIVETQGYQPGDCVETTISAEDGGDVAEGHRVITLLGRVDERGVVYFKEPLKDYTLIIFDGRMTKEDAE